MARVIGLTTLTYNSKSLTPDGTKLDFPQDSDVEDTTNFASAGWHENTGTLKGGGDITVEMFYNNQSVASEGYLFWVANLGTSATFAWGDGTRSISCAGIVTKIPTAIPVGNLIKHTITIKQTGAITST